MAVITVSRQVGSLGTEIAREAAQRLRYEYVDKEKLEQLLKGFGFPEPQVEKFDEKKPPFWDARSLERRKFLHATQAVLYDLASKGRVVIVGRGGQVLLKQVPGVLHVRIVAPFEKRLKRMVETGGFDEKQAARFLRQSDQDSLGYLQTFFHVNWDDPSLYDLILNTAHLSVETAAQIVTDAALSPDLTGKEDLARDKMTELALGQKVEAQLMDVLGAEIRNVEVEAKKGTVLLRGAVASAQIRENCEEVVAALEGVQKVENQLTVSQYHRYGT
ncbi:MAG: cytidylate kinase family protein [Syntrophaceae bacterium]|nr:cytidylate kinase family protein [Syntrophaceae bacterium]